ncbi:PQQ-binding-like beta-propeller repeat protein [Actinoplanes sp. NPDC024001]|uniref:outer membrane protein assembly factor BamB family protein n=1 Tax=Actinoplanes sp. NPDC024001 TaxID=3154598 RepID=UPI0033C44E0D
MVAEKGGEMAVPGSGDSGTVGGETQPTVPQPHQAGAPARFTPGLAPAADPAPTAATVPHHPVLADTRVEGPPTASDARTEGPPTASDTRTEAAPTASDARTEGAPQSPAPQNVTPQSPTPHNAAPQSPTPHNAAPQSPAPHYAAPQSPAPQSPAPQSPAAPAGSASRADNPDEGERTERIRTEPDPEYVAPVDPWAAAEAAAIAGGHVPFHLSDPNSPAHPHSTWTIQGAPGTPPETPGRPRRAYRKGVWAAIAAGAVALGVTAAVLLWPGYPALDFRQLDQGKTFDAMVPISSSWSSTGIAGDRAYYASSDSDGKLGVVAVDIDSRKEVWRTEVTDSRVTGWQQMVALPSGVALFSTLNSATSQTLMVVLDADDSGRRLWDRPLGSSDEVHFGAKNALVEEKGEGRLLWLSLGTGKVAHEQDDPDSSHLVEVTTGKDLSGPAGVFGRPLDPDHGDDPRIVQINGDNSANVLDIDSPKILKSRKSVANTSNEALAHDGRLYVQDSTGDAQRIFAYDLNELGEPVTLYTAGPDSTLSTFAPCGEQRLCFVETDGYDRKKDRVIAVDAVKGGILWDEDMPEVESLAPVGDSVLVTRSSADDEVALIDGDGAKVWTATGRAARLDGGNLLRFADPLTASLGNRTLSGVHLGDTPVPMGEIRDVYTASCSWNTSVLACVGQEKFMLFRIAG